MKKIIFIALIIVASVALGFKALQPKLVAKAFDKRIAANIGVDTSVNLVDGLHVYMCGAGSPLPDPKRSGPCMGVIAGTKVFIFDAGSGSIRNLGPMGFPIGRLDKVFLTHLHSDHIDGLGELMMQAWINGGRTAPLPISGPVGTAQVVNGFNAAYAIDSGYRTAHHGTNIAHPDGAGGTAEEMTLSGASQVVFEQGDVKITAFIVSHEPVSPAFGYRIDYKDRSVSISGDTAYDPNIAVQSKNVDVLFHEALNMEIVTAFSQAASSNGNARLAKVFGDILDYHTSPVDAARIATSSEAKELVLYHIVPMLPSDALIPLFVKGAGEQFRGKITVSSDGHIVRLPVGNSDIHHETGL